MIYFQRYKRDYGVIDVETQAFEIIQGIIADELTKRDFGEARDRN